MSPKGFGHHVKENSEKLRRRFVAHDGKKKLSVNLDDTSQRGWVQMVERFSNEIRNVTDRCVTASQGDSGTKRELAQG